VTCNSDECTTRTCNGTSACSISYASLGSPCGNDAACGCSGSGACVFPENFTSYCYDPNGNMTARVVVPAGQACLPVSCP
jgi:hypothetical protein